jgi:hypothetical protein
MRNDGCQQSMALVLPRRSELGWGSGAFRSSAESAEAFLANMRDQRLCTTRLKHKARQNLSDEDETHGAGRLRRRMLLLTPHTLDRRARLTTHTEYPNDVGIGCNKRSKMDTTHYLAFLAQLRKAVGSKLITAAVPILGFTGPDGAPLADASAFAQYFDFLIIMVRYAAALAHGS